MSQLQGPPAVPAWGGEGVCDTHMCYARGHTGTCMLILTQLYNTLATPQNHLWSVLKNVPFLKTKQVLFLPKQLGWSGASTGYSQVIHYPLIGSLQGNTCYRRTSPPRSHSSYLCTRALPPGPAPHSALSGVNPQTNSLVSEPAINLPFRKSALYVPCCAHSDGKFHSVQTSGQGAWESSCKMPASWEVPTLRSLEGPFCVMNLTAQKDLHTHRAGGSSCLQCSGATGLARSQTRLLVYGPRYRVGAWLLGATLGSPQQLEEGSLPVGVPSWVGQPGPPPPESLTSGGGRE